MNKQELIKRISELPYLEGPIADTVTVNRNWILGSIEQLDKPQEVPVPQFVADWYEANKDDFERCLREEFEYMDANPLSEMDDFQEWLLNDENKPFQTLVNMHQFGYEVEKEKRYYVKAKKIADGCNYLNCRTSKNEWSFSGISEPIDYRTRHTRKELENAGFGWVFDCEGIELEEVTE